MVDLKAFRNYRNQAVVVEHPVVDKFQAVVGIL